MKVDYYNSRLVYLIFQCEVFKLLYYYSREHLLVHVKHKLMIVGEIKFRNNPSKQNMLVLKGKIRQK